MTARHAATHGSDPGRPYGHATSSFDREAACTTRTIRVLHIIKDLGLGGAETNLLNLAGAFDPRSVETHVAYARGGEIEPRFRAAGVRLFEYARQDHRVKSVWTLAIVLRLARYIRRCRIDIVHTHNFSGHVWGMLAAKLTGTKLVEHVHDFRYTPLEQLAQRHGLLDQYRFTPYLRGRSDRVVVLTDAHRDFVIEHRYSTQERVVRVPNGITFDGPSSRRGEPAEEVRAMPDEVVILTAARMDPTKNIELIFRIAAEVRKRAPRAVFVIAGSGVCLGAYRERCSGMGLDSFVRLIGFHHDIEALLASSDIFLLPSWLELHSIAILEAMKMRLPVVVSRGVGCNDDFIDDGANGFLCDPASDSLWIDALTRLCSEPDLRHRIGNAGHETGRRLFNLADTADRFEHLYRDLVDEAVPG